MSSLKALLTMGAIGSGKTTLAASIFRLRQLESRKITFTTLKKPFAAIQRGLKQVAYIFNDCGTSETIDAAAFAGSVAFSPLTAGCFGCRDVASLKQTLQTVEKKGFEWVVIEPLGFIAGHEVPNVLNALHIQTHVVSLLDVQNLHENDALGFQPSQLKAASAVGLTKCPPNAEIGDSSLEEAVDYVSKHAPGTPVFVLRKGEGLPQSVLESFQEHTHEHCGHDHHHGHCDHHHHVHGHDHAHDHDHESHEHAHGDHDHEHDHGVFPYSVFLRGEVLFGMVQTLFEDARLGSVFLAKGVTGDGLQFHMVHGTWSEPVKDETNKPFLTVYSSARLDDSVFQSIRAEKGEASATPVRTEALIRDGSTVSPEATNAAVRRLLTQVPRKPIVTETGIVPNPEQHELLNELRKRPGVEPALNDEAIRARVEYYLACAELMVPDGKWWNVPNYEISGEKKRNIAVGIGWFAKNKPEVLGEKILKRVQRIDLARFLGDGLGAGFRHNEDRDRAFSFMREVRDVLEFIGRFDRRLDNGIFHAAVVAGDHEGLKEEWFAMREAWWKKFSKKLEK